MNFKLKKKGIASDGKTECANRQMGKPAGKCTAQACVCTWKQVLDFHINRFN